MDNLNDLTVDTYYEIPIFLLLNSFDFSKDIFLTYKAQKDHFDADFFDYILLINSLSKNTDFLHLLNLNLDKLWKWCKILETDGEMEVRWRRIGIGIIGISTQFAFVIVFQIQMQHLHWQNSPLISDPIYVAGVTDDY